MKQDPKGTDAAGDRTSFDQEEEVYGRSAPNSAPLTIATAAPPQRSGPNEPTPKKPTDPARRAITWDFRARGEPFIWGLGGALVIGIMMIMSFLLFVVYNGALTFYPLPIEVVELRDEKPVAGAPTRKQTFRPSPEVLKALPQGIQADIESEKKGLATRILYQTGNFDLYNDYYRWVPEFDIIKRSTPADMYFIERLEWGPFVGKIKTLDLNGKIVDGAKLDPAVLQTAMAQAVTRRDRITHLERGGMATISFYSEKERLRLRKVGLRYGEDSPEYSAAKERYEAKTKELDTESEEIAKEHKALKSLDEKYTITMADVNGQEKTVPISGITRLYPANRLSFSDKMGVYISRWWEFLSNEPREGNTAGGVLPAIFGTFCMTMILAVVVAPFGVVTALYLREYAKQGRIVSLVRISVNNLAGVPSIVYGVFGLGFFAYMLGGTIDQLFFPERLPNPTFGTGGLLWASLTLALLTVPVVIVATEEALAAVPQSMREGSLACGASKWQTIKWIVLPRAMPGIMTGLILAMARGAEEVAPLMLVGVVNVAPQLPLDGFFPFIHLERSFMHLGFHIYDLGFHTPNSEAARPMVYVTTFLLIVLVFAMNGASIVVRNRLKRKFQGGHF